MSSEFQICEVCGARLPANTPGWPCPACLVRSAIDQHAKAGSSASEDPQPKPAASAKPTTQAPRAEVILAHAVALRDPREREAYLLEACGADAALRAEVESLLGAFAEAGEFLETPVSSPALA